MRRAVSQKLFLFIVCFIATLPIFATDVYLPSFLAIESHFQSPATIVKMTLTLYFLSFSTMQLFWGPLSDKLGRKKAILYGLAFSLIGTLLCLFAENIGMLILGRFLQGAGFAVGATFRAILRDAYHGDELSQKGSYIAIINSAFMAIAPVFGGYLQEFFGWRGSFFFLTIYTILALTTLLLFLPESNKELKSDVFTRKVFLKSYQVLIKSPIFLSYLGCSSLGLAGLTAYLTASPFLFQGLMGLSPVEYGWLAIYVAAGLTLGGLSNAFFVKKAGRHKLMQGGAASMLFAGLLMLVPGLFGYINTTVVITPMVFYMIGVGSVFTNAATGALLPFPKSAGFAGALYGCFQMGGGAIGSLIMAAIPERSQIPLASFLLLIAALIFALQKLGAHHSVKEGFH